MPDSEIKLLSTELVSCYPALITRTSADTDSVSNSHASFCSALSYLWYNPQLSIPLVSLQGPLVVVVDSGSLTLLVLGSDIAI